MSPHASQYFSLYILHTHTHTHNLDSSHAIQLNSSHSMAPFFCVSVLLCKDSCIQSLGNLCLMLSSFTQQLTAFHLGGYCEYEPRNFCLEFPDIFNDKLKYFTSLFTFLLWWVHVLIVMEDFKRLGNWGHAGKSKDLTEIRWAFPKCTVPGATSSIKLP